jgi:hypothetical protein
MALVVAPDRRRDQALWFVAIILSAVALGAALAHALELPNKIGMSREDYLVVQQAYRGWDLLGWLLIAQLASLAVLAVRWRHSPEIARPLVAAILFLAAAQAIFWALTFPANVATANWTHLPGDWEALRARWEYSHAAGALCQLLVMASLTLAALRRG